MCFHSHLYEEVTKQFRRILSVEQTGITTITKYFNFKISISKFTNYHKNLSIIEKRNNCIYTLKFYNKIFRIIIIYKQYTNLCTHNFNLLYIPSAVMSLSADKNSTDCLGSLKENIVEALWRVLQKELPTKAGALGKKQYLPDSVHCTSLCFKDM